MNEQEYADLLCIKAPQEIEKEVFENKLMYPSATQYRSEKQITERIRRVKEMLSKTKSASRQTQLKNELLILLGKKFTLFASKTGTPLGIIKGFHMQIMEDDPFFGEKKTEEEKKEWAKQMAEVTAMFFHTGKKVIEFNRKTKK